MKKMRLLEFIFMPLSLMMLLQPVGFAQENKDIKVMSVTGSTMHSLSIAMKQYINMEGLTWVGGGVPWKEVVGKTISFQPIARNYKGLTENRYGYLNGKILMPPHGWMQRYWIGTGEAVVSGAGPYPQMMHQALLQAEQEARALKLGRWAHWTPIQAAETDAFSARDGFQIIEGQVKEVRKIRGVIYLNFGKDWKSDFTAAISSKNRINFRRADWKLADLMNKWVRIRGRLRTYNGPYMELIFPEQIEIVE